MTPLSPTQVLALIHPALAFVFAFSFLCMWFFNRNRPHLVLFFWALCSYALALTSQIMQIPSDIGSNPMVSAALYIASALILSEGLLLRSGYRLGYAFHAGAAAVLLGLVYYYFYVQPNLTVRIYVLNCGIGLVLVYAAIRLRSLATGRLVDRLLFWVFLGFALHFFPRTILSLGSIPNETAQVFAASTTWLLFQLSMVVLGGILVMMLLAASVVDVIDDLRKDRDTDALTGLLNRGGFEQRAAAQVISPNNRRSA
ncbi:MAG: hypothetical protein WDN49_03910 [Acetobacteraceae bacterium]